MSPTSTDRMALVSDAVAALARAPAGIVRRHVRVTLDSGRPPWTMTDLDLAAGDEVSWFACGETCLRDAPALRLPAHFQVWARVGERGQAFRGTRASHSFTAAQDGRLCLATYFPGEWSSPEGALACSPDAYAMVAGDIEVVVIQWAAGVDAASGLRALCAADASVEPWAAELDRLAHDPRPPAGWHYLWYLGPAEIYAAPTGVGSDEDTAIITCDTHDDVGILQHEAPFACEPGTRLCWRWRVDELPSRVAEDAAATHDYLSIAVEFADGQDITYYWSATLPAGTSFRCPLPNWHARETHVVVRSGAGDLGVWRNEERDVHADYLRLIGPTPVPIVRIWLIAVSLFQKGRGRCRYSDIELRGTAERLRVA